MPYRETDCRALARIVQDTPKLGKGDRAVLVTVTNRGPVGIVSALRADDLLDLLFHPLAQRTQPETPTVIASSPAFAAPTSCPSASCTRACRTASSIIACATGKLLFTAVRMKKSTPWANSLGYEFLVFGLCGLSALSVVIGSFGDLHARAAVAGSKLESAQLACG